MLKILCDKCGEEINEGAALVFSPPTGNMVGKYHICVHCWNELEYWIKTANTFPIIKKDY
jgi:hypothetical protein